ncbi:CBS domain-containing protein [Kitasatospora paracochleata]|uniref:CBS domain-containing protein n=1 Tax=Kitasatospora paracochleata TaxID=58354 RepID=A0ABT1J1V7_9ACTN|nr:CBS domain-containing protein [Kitasatospora paracochleata]MCP2311420.1 CBS domain-containing protein [Kitasatospora paracochleata]
MRVAELMSAPPVTVPPTASVRDAARRMAAAEVGCVLVADREALRGVLTDRDLAVRWLAADADPDPTVPVAAVMSSPAVTVGAEEDLSAAYRAFRRTGVRRLPVVDGTRPVGVLAIDDLFLDVLQHLADLLGPVSWSALREGPAGPGRTGSTPPTAP